MNSRTQVTVAPKGMGLNDFVAQREGFFAAEGLDVFFDWKTFRGTQSSWKELAYFERPQDKPYAEGRDVIQGACAWGSICSRVPAGAGACRWFQSRSSRQGLAATHETRCTLAISFS
jgi:hypothetical protein